MPYNLDAMKTTGFILVIAFLVACQSKPEGTEGTGAEPQMITLSSQSLQSLSPTYDSLRSVEVSTPLALNGKVDVPPQNLITVPAPVAAYVRETHLLQGMAVEPGEVLAILEGPEVVQVQQDYLEAATQEHLLGLELERQQRLRTADANAQKTLEQAEAQNTLALTRKYAGAERLRLLGLNPEGITPQRIKAQIELISPIRGYVKEVHVNRGQYLQAAQPLFELVHTAHLHIELSALEQDLPRLAEGQPIRFGVAGEEGMPHRAQVHLLAHSVESDNVVRVHGHIEGDAPKLVPGQFVKALVYTQPTMRFMVPTRAVVRRAGQSYVLVVSAPGKFLPTPVRTGAVEEGRTEILNSAVLTGKRFLVNGAWQAMGDEE